MNHVSYVSVREFRDAPTGIDTSQIVPDGTEDQNEIELFNVLLRASAWVNTIVEMETLNAVTDTEVIETRLTRKGEFRVSPRNTPIISVSDVQYRAKPSDSWVSVSNDYVDVYRNYFVARSVGSFGFHPSITVESTDYLSPTTRSAIADQRVSLRWTYVNGYANTDLAVASVVGASTLVVTDATGITAGQRLTIYDNEKTEQVVVSGSYVSGTSVSLASPTTQAHGIGAGISALPASIKQATILLASSLIKQRGSMSITMTGSPSTLGGGVYDQNDVKTATKLLLPFRRVVVS